MAPDSPAGPLLTIDKPSIADSVAPHRSPAPPTEALPLMEELLAPPSLFTLAPATIPEPFVAPVRLPVRPLFGLRDLITTVLLVLATAQFINHAPPVSRSIPFWDFTNVYSAARVWLSGGNPYDMQQVFHAYAQSNPASPLASPDPAGLSTWGSLQPPSALLLLAPLAKLSAIPASIAWLVVSFGLVAMWFPALFSIAGITDKRSRWLLVAATLAAAPLQQGLHTGQISLIGVTFVIFAIWAVSRDQRLLAGALLGLAVSIKLPLAAPFAIYYFLVGEIRICAWTTIVATLTCMLGALQLEAHGVPWLFDLHQNVVQGFAPGGLNDPRIGSPWRHALLNVGILFYDVCNDPATVAMLAYAVVSAMTAVFLRALIRTRNAATDLLCLSVVAAIGLLPVYHRLYDAALLVLPLAWAVARLENDRHNLAHLTLVVLAPFLIPFELVLALALRVHAIGHFTQSRAGQMFLVNQYCWQTLIAAAWLLFVFHRTRSSRFATERGATQRQPSDQQWAGRAFRPAI